MKKNNAIGLFLVILISLFIIYALTKLQPTFDDWTYLTYPNEDPDIIKFLLPHGTYWRPFDALFGYLLALDPQLFPALNHIVIYPGHLLGATMVYVVSRQLRFKRYAARIGAAFYFVSPAMLGAVLDIDSLNQIYSAALGLVALAVYLSPYKHRTCLWVVLCLLATLWKENGAMWLFVVPLIAYTFERTDKSTFIRHIALGAICLAAYAAVRLMLPNHDPVVENEYLQYGLMKRLENLAKFLLLTFCSADFISLFYKPERNLPFLILTLALSLPMLYVMAVKNRHIWMRKKPLLLLSAALLAAAPHLLTLFSTMHAYAALGIVALLPAYIINQDRHHRKRNILVFLLFVLSAIAVDVRHYAAAYRSGMIGVDMAQQVISQTKHPARKAFCIIIDRNERKYSMFCVIPYDAFGWGMAVYYHTRHQWPKTLKNQYISADYAQCCLDNMISKKLKAGYDHVWIVDGTQVKVVEK